MSPPRCRAVALTLAFAAGGCAAHLPAPGERVAFLERSTISVSSDRRQAFEADPALHLLLWNGLDDGKVLDEGGFATVASMSFLGAFRMLRGDSAPVRLPTYEPRARLQLFRGAVLHRSGGEMPGPSHRLLGALELFVGHRSNGQDGCALERHTRYGSSDFACTPDTSPADERLNVNSGSFTTNYVGTGVGAVWVVPRPQTQDPAAAVTGAASIEWNLACSLGACMPSEMRTRYGVALVRWSLDVEVPALWTVAVARREADVGIRGGLSGSTHAAAASRKPFGDASAELAVVARLRSGLATGIFVRRHQGSDPLNIRFEERLDAWFLGVSLEPGSASSMRRAPGS